MDLTLIIVIVCAFFALGLIVLYFSYGRGQNVFTMDIGGGAPHAAGGSDESVDGLITTRLKWLGIGSTGIFAIILARLASMQLGSHDEYTKLAEQNRARSVSIAAPRGRILDRNGREIVNNRSSLVVVSEPDVVGDEIEMTLLANLIGMPELAVRRKIQDSSAGAQSRRTIAADVSRRVVAYLGAHPATFPGVSVEERTERSYPYGSLAAHVVGYTGVVTSEQLESSKSGDGSEVTYRSGDIVGQSGVEYEYESVLQGIRGEQMVYVDAGGNILDYSTTIAPKSGSDVLLTIDLDVQKEAEESIARVLDSVRNSGLDGSGASCVAMDCTNGDILCMASSPTYNPSVFVGGISNADWELLQSEEANYPLMNRAISGQSPSGSIIKALTALSGLEYGIIEVDNSWYCTGWWEGLGSNYGMHCWSTHGYVNIQTGITFSCDVVFYEIGKGFYYSDTPEGMQELFRRYGLGSTTGVDLPSEAAGRVPDAEWKWNYWKNADDDQRRWMPGDMANLSIGQGDLLVTCLQMVNAYCGVATAGTIYRPHVLKSVKAASGDGSVIDYKPEITREPYVDLDDLKVVKRGLYGVCYEEDPSMAAHWNTLSVTVEGKTGTAEQTNRDSMCWFMCYAPAENPRYVVGANVDGANSGAATAMIICRDILGAIYGEPDTSNVVTSVADR